MCGSWQIRVSVGILEVAGVRNPARLASREEKGHPREGEDLESQVTGPARVAGLTAFSPPLPGASLSCCHSLSSAHGATCGRHRSRPGPRPVSLPTRGSESVLELFQPESWATWPWPKHAGRVLSLSEISKLLGRSHERAARPRSSTSCSGRLVEIGGNSPGPHRNREEDRLLTDEEQKSTELMGLRSRVAGLQTQAAWLSVYTLNPQATSSFSGKFRATAVWAGRMPTAS